MANQDLLTKIDHNAAEIRAYRPLSELEVRELDAHYKILDHLRDQSAAGGRHHCGWPAHPGLLRGHRPRQGSGELSITEDVIHRLHRLFYHGIDPDAAGQYRTGQVFITGTSSAADGLFWFLFA